MGTEEAQLVRSARAGDDQAFGRLVEPYLDPLYRTALRIMRGRPEAEDAVQEALYRAWRALPSFRGDAKFYTWLYRILWRVCADLASGRETLPLEVDAEDGTADRDPERRLEAAESRSEIEEALRKLPAHYRAALTLYYVEDLPVCDIAEILGLPAGTVKTHLHRARKALRESVSGLL